MVLPQYRIFFDTSVYIAALLSPGGAAGELVRLAEAGVIRMVVSEEVIVESDRVLAGKFPELVQESRRLWKHLNPEMAPDPTASQIKPFLEKLSKGDASILCAAHLAFPKVSAFVTWNTRDFIRLRRIPRLFKPWMNAVKSRGASVDSAPRNSRRITPSALIHEVNQQGVKPGTTGFSPWGSMAQGVASLVDCPVVVPADCLSLFRKWVDPFLR